MRHSFLLSALIVTRLIVTRLIVTISIATASTLVFAEEKSANPPIFDWTTTEMHYQYGNHFERPFSTEREQQATVYTLQHADGWKYGDNFLFVDVY